MYTLILTTPSHLSHVSTTPPFPFISDVHALLTDFLPSDKYFRFNPLLGDNLAIDEKNKSVLLDLKRVAKEMFKKYEKGAQAKNLDFMFSTLKGTLRWK